MTEIQYNSIINTGTFSETLLQIFQFSNIQSIPNNLYTSQVDSLSPFYIILQGNAEIKPNIVPLTINNLVIPTYSTVISLIREGIVKLQNQNHYLSTGHTIFSDTEILSSENLLVAPLNEKFMQIIYEQIRNRQQQNSLTFIQQFNAFAMQELQIQRKIVQKMEKYIFKKNDLIISSQIEATHILIVKEGDVLIQKNKETYIQSNNSFLGLQEYCSMSQNYTTLAIANSIVELYTLSFEHLEKFIPRDDFDNAQQNSNVGFPKQQTYYLTKQPKINVFQDIVKKINGKQKVAQFQKTDQLMVSFNKPLLHGLVPFNEKLSQNKYLIHKYSFIQGQFQFSRNRSKRSHIGSISKTQQTQEDLEDIKCQVQLMVENMSKDISKQQLSLISEKRSESLDNRYLLWKDSIDQKLGFQGRLKRHIKESKRFIDNEQEIWEPQNPWSCNTNKIAKLKKK